MKITLEFDEHGLSTKTDQFLAALWHAGQFNQAPGDDAEACRTAELIGREIIRRWLGATAPALWNRQGSHETSLRDISERAHARSVIEAACAVLETDPQSTMPADREKVCAAIERLADAVRVKI